MTFKVDKGSDANIEAVTKKHERTCVIEWKRTNFSGALATAGENLVLPRLWSEEFKHKTNTPRGS